MYRRMQCITWFICTWICTCKSRDIIKWRDFISFIDAFTSANANDGARGSPNLCGASESTSCYKYVPILYDYFYWIWISIHSFYHTDVNTINSKITALLTLQKLFCDNLFQHSQFHIQNYQHRGWISSKWNRSWTKLASKIGGVKCDVKNNGRYTPYA